jgi:hypothetical protein
LSGTVTNAGTITGSPAIVFGGTGANRLIVDPGAVFSGAVSGSTSAGAGNTLELASAASTGTLSGLGTNFTNFKTVAEDGGASWKLTAANESGQVDVGSGATLMPVRDCGPT